jgi:hypothetical protein
MKSRSLAPRRAPFAHWVPAHGIGDPIAAATDRGHKP